MTGNPPVDVQQYGQSIWLDFIHRKSLQDGEMQRYIDEYGVIGVTSNPAIFQKAIGESDTYDSAIKTMLDLDAYDIYERLAVADIQQALDLFRPIYDQTNAVNGYVSLEVSPLIANDTATTIAEAKRLFALVNRPNLMIKIPATPAGIPAIEEAIAAGINVNVTLIFSVKNYEEVAQAFIKGLERRLAQGQSVQNIASVASFFISRIDIQVEKMLESNIRAAQGRDLDRVGANRELLGVTAIANAKLAYRRFMDIFYGERFAALRKAGAQVQRPLWASTGMKSPNYKDTLYVETLIGKDTVNTLPPATLKAFKDHGLAADTLASGFDVAAKQLASLSDMNVGIDLAAVTDQLQQDGVALFVDAFQNLLDQVDAKRNMLVTGVHERQNLALGTHEDDIKSAINMLDAEHVNARIWAHDGSVWKDQPAAITKIKQRLGWLDTQQTIDLARLQALKASIPTSGVSAVVLLGMGGSSLAPEVLYRVFGKQAGYPTLHLLDSTDPAWVSAVEQKIDLPHTLFVVSSKSGSTTETNAFFEYFYARTGGNGQQFIAITDPDTSLAQLAQDKGFRDTFLNPADIGGRYSALSYFGFVPAALMGLDLERLWQSAADMMLACAKNIPARHHPGLSLGAIMAVTAKAGRDKLTILASDQITALGNWIEQLVAESTGKEGRGILPVVGATIGNPHDYSSDRLFVYLKLEGAADNDLMDTGIRALREAGHPRVVYYLPDAYAIAGEFFRWEYATAIAGRLLEINPFDEPNVTESKEKTARLLKIYNEKGALPAQESAFRSAMADLYADAKLLKTLGQLCLQYNYNTHDMISMVAAFINSTRANDYFAVLAYLPPTDALQQALAEVQRRMRHSTRRAVTLGWGPRYLHSTGQLHKGGGNNGHFIQLTCDAARDLPIPNAPYTFGVLQAAQAAGDLEALQGKDRRVLRLHLKGDDVLQGLELLTQAIELVDSRRK